MTIILGVLFVVKYTMMGDINPRCIFVVKYTMMGDYTLRYIFVVKYAMMGDFNPGCIVCCQVHNDG